MYKKKGVDVLCQLIGWLNLATLFCIIPYWWKDASFEVIFAKNLYIYKKEKPKRMTWYIQIWVILKIWNVVEFHHPILVRRWKFWSRKWLWEWRGGCFLSTHGLAQFSFPILHPSTLVRRWKFWNISEYKKRGVVAFVSTNRLA